MNKNLVMITGASSGIGQACAEVFSQAGYSLLLLARRLQPMLDLKLPNTICRSVDITDYNNVRQCISHIENEGYTVDCLVNNAGMLVVGDYNDTEPEAESEMVNLNLKGVIHCAKAVLPNMKHHQNGTVINVSSIGGRMFSSANAAIYCATKAAVDQFTQSLHATYSKENIRCCNIAPAYIETPMWDGLESPSHEGTGLKMISATKMAEIILWTYQQPQELCIRDIVVTPTKSPI